MKSDAAIEVMQPGAKESQEPVVTTVDWERQRRMDSPLQSSEGLGLPADTLILDLEKGSLMG